MKVRPTPRGAFALFNNGSSVLDFAKRRKLVVYGAQSVGAQLGGLARNTKDYDLSTTRSPHGEATLLTNRLNREAGQKYYYEQESKRTKGVHKVYFIGADLKRGTDDDVAFVDVTKRKLPFVTIGGVRYARLSSTVKDKRLALSDQAYAFRHRRDREDLNRIQAYQRIRRLQGRR